MALESWRMLDMNGIQLRLITWVMNINTVYCKPSTMIYQQKLVVSTCLTSPYLVLYLFDLDVSRAAFSNLPSIGPSFLLDHPVILSRPFRMIFEAQKKEAELLADLKNQAPAFWWTSMGDTPRYPANSLLVFLVFTYPWRIRLVLGYMLT